MSFLLLINVSILEPTAILGPLDILMSIFSLVPLPIIVSILGILSVVILVPTFRLSRLLALQAGLVCLGLGSITSSVKVGKQACLELE